MTEKNKLSDREKTETILQELIKKYNSFSSSRCNVLFPELRLGSGYSDISERRIDLFMISSEKGNYTTAFEIKVSRGDFLKDIKDFRKQRGARLYSSNFYYVAPEGMIDPEEIPMWAGLLEYNFESGQFIKKIVAPLQSRNTPSWSLICSMIRRVNGNLYIDKIEELQNLNKVYAEYIKRAHSLLTNIELGKFNNQKDLLKIAIDSYKRDTKVFDYNYKTEADIGKQIIYQ